VLVHVQCSAQKVYHACSREFESLWLTYNARRYTLAMVIKSFQCADTESLFERESVKRFRSIERVSFRKLQKLHAATLLSEMVFPPGNRLEALKGRRAGQHSIRINEQ